MTRPLVETMRTVPESEALLAIIDPEQHADSLQGLGVLTVTHIEDTWSESNSAQIVGHVDNEGVRYPTEFIILFPGFFKRSLAKIRRREPTAQVHLTVLDPDLYQSLPSEE